MNPKTLSLHMDFVLIITSVVGGVITALMPMYLRSDVVWLWLLKCLATAEFMFTNSRARHLNSYNHTTVRLQILFCCGITVLNLFIMTVSKRFLCVYRKYFSIFSLFSFLFFCHCNCCTSLTHPSEFPPSFRTSGGLWWVQPVLYLQWLWNQCK